MFIDGKRSKNKNKWHWTKTKQAIPDLLLPFGNGKPDNHGGDEDCLEILNEGGFIINDVPCNFTRFFVCQDKNVSLIGQ